MTFEYLQAHPHQESATSAAPSNTLHARDDSPVLIDEDSPAPSEDEDESGDGDGDTLKITLRSAITKPLTLTVRQTTKCSAIIQAFLKHHNLTDKYASSPAKGKKKGKAASSGPALSVDGDKLNLNDEISVADLEDGDMVEVVGL